MAEKGKKKLKEGVAEGIRTEDFEKRKKKRKSNIAKAQEKWQQALAAMTPREREFCKKTTQIVFTSDKITRNDLMRALYNAFREARPGKRKTLDEIKFEFNWFENLSNLVDSIIYKVYGASRGIAFIVTDPVIREIFAAAFRDRSVHHLLYDLCYEWWDRRFISNSCSCRVGKGTLAGAKQLQRDMRKCSQNGKIDATIYKFDLSGYFMSLNRKMLYERVCSGADIQFKQAPRLKKLVKFLWRKVIFDDPTKDVTIRGSSYDWRRLAASKSLFFQQPGTGIVIGNLTSQLLSNIYLDILDQYVVHELGYKYYGRYVDDFYIVIEDKDKKKLKKDIKRIEEMLAAMGLTLHPRKRYAQPVKHGATFLGMKVYLQHIQPGKRIKKNFRRLVHNVAQGVTDKQELLTNYDGILLHTKADKMIKEVYDEVGWTYGEFEV